MSYRFAIVHEAEADFRIASVLADRVLINAIEWLDDDLIRNQREWIGEIPVDRRLTWKEMPRLAREIGIKAHGHFDGQPGEADAAAARRAILVLKQLFPDLNAIVLLRDQDDQPERLAGLNQARNLNHGETVIVIGLAIVEREAWVISGFDPQNQSESDRVDAERRTLGFNPCNQSHQLTACKNDQAIRSPKRVLRALTSGDSDRERVCWESTPLEQLRQRGTENGLAAFLAEVRDRLAPLMGHVANG